MGFAGGQAGSISLCVVRLEETQVHPGPPLRVPPAASYPRSFSGYRQGGEADIPGSRMQPCVPLHDPERNCLKSTNAQLPLT